MFIGRTDAEAEVPILWPPDVKSLMLGKIVKKEFLGPGLHLRPVLADRARHLSSGLCTQFSPYGNDNRRIRPPPDRGTLKIISRLLLT